MTMTYFYKDAIAPNFYFDTQFNIEATKIEPGEYCATSGPKLIVTAVGSCVSACIRDSKSGIGGMNHFMLPNIYESKKPVDRFCDAGLLAMESLISQLLVMGAERSNLEARLFGGGNILNAFSANNAGESSYRFAQTYLAENHIPVVSKDVLDVYPRKIYFFPQTGRTVVKKLKRLNNETIIQREQDYAARFFIG
jgi:chemotaxis protein CheD